MAPQQMVPDMMTEMISRSDHYFIVATILGFKFCGRYFDANLSSFPLNREVDIGCCNLRDGMASVGGTSSASCAEHQA